MSEMENRFKADLNGWLEYSSKQSPQEGIDAERNNIRIYDNFEQTMKYYNFTESAKEALHNVIFYALTKHQDYKTDFDLPRFEKTISHKDYWELIRDYNLYAYTKRELWKMDPKLALNLLHILYRQTDTIGHMFYKTHIQIALCLNENDDRFNKEANTIIYFGKHNKIPQMLKLIEIGYECMENAFQMKNSRQNLFTAARLERMFEYMDLLFSVMTLRQIILSANTIEEKQLIYSTVYATIALIEENGYIQKALHKSGLYKCVEAMHKMTTLHLVKLSNREFPLSIVETEHMKVEISSSTLTLKEFAKRVHYQESIESKHEHTFKTIVSYILLKNLPNQHDRDSSISEEEEPGFDRLEDIIITNEDRCEMLKLKLGCVQIIRDRNMFWKSILKVMIQFLDLWISDILDAKCADIFANLIVQENMMMDLHQLIVKHVQHHHSIDNPESLKMIKNSTHLLEKCFNCFDSNQRLLQFRDHLYKTSHFTGNVPLPLLGSISFWNILFDQEMIKVTNQITSIEDDAQVPQEITRKLIILTIIWPYEVVRQLFLSCTKNKNQYKAIVPILYSLSTNSIWKRVLFLVLKNTITVENSEFLNEHMENICQFIKECCNDKSYNQDIPLILVPSDHMDQLLVLLDFKKILCFPILESLTSYLHCLRDNGSEERYIILFRFAIYALNSFCEPFSATKYDWSTVKLSSSDLPYIIACYSDEYISRLTRILAIRFSHTWKQTLLSIQDWESILKFIDKFSTIVLCALQGNPDQFKNKYDFLIDVCGDPEYSIDRLDWKAQFLWYNVTRCISNVPMRVPTSLFQITGGLDSVFFKETLFDEDTETNKSLGTMKGWYDLFTACKLSTRLTDEIFKCSDQWMYNLILLWKHPYEDTLVEDCLYYTLYPETSLSASIEYPKLLVYFLGKLYDSITGAHEMIRDYSSYESAEMIPFIHDLSETGTNNYYIILNIMKLLKRNLKQKLATDDKQDTYFISRLVKVLQDLTNWANISQEGQASSYNELKLRIKDMLSSNAPVPHTAQSNNDTIKQAHAESYSTIAESSPETKILYYPLLNTAELISNRALSLLTFYHLCSLFHDARKEDNQRQAIERSILQIMDGLIDMTSRQSFQRMLQQQPRSRIVNWKKKGSNSKFVMIMRPILTPAEEKLLKPVIVENVPNSEQILKALGLTAVQEGKSSKKISNKENLYFS